MNVTWKVQFDQGCPFKGLPKKNRQTGLGLLDAFAWAQIRDQSSFGLLFLPKRSQEGQGRVGYA